MKNLIVIAFLFAATTTSAQVGIGTATPNASAQLDVTSTNKGLLPPRVALTSTTDVSTISSPATGLVVYNTANTSDVIAGYYYYSGSSWNRLMTGIKTAVEAWAQTLGASSSGKIYFSQHAGYPVIPENLPDGFTVDIVNYSNSHGALTTLSTAKYHTKNSGWNNGTGLTSVTIVSGGTVRLQVFTINSVKRYFITGDIQ